MNESANSPDTAGNIRLAASIGVREGAVLKQQLLPLIDLPEVVALEVSAVESIDTSALQLLLAFSLERSAKGLSTLIEGDSAAFATAATAVGVALGTAAAAGCNHES